MQIRSMRVSYRVSRYLEGGVGCGSGEARAFSDVRFLNCVSWSYCRGSEEKGKICSESRLSSGKWLKNGLKMEVF